MRQSLEAAAEDIPSKQSKKDHAKLASEEIEAAADMLLEWAHELG